MTIIVSNYLFSEIYQMVKGAGIIFNGKMTYQVALENLHRIDKTKTLRKILVCSKAQFHALLDNQPS